MRARFSPRFRSLARLALGGCVAALLAGCAAPGPKPEGYSIEQNHKIQVLRKAVSLSIRLPQTGVALASDDAARFKRFLNDYVQRGRSVVTVESTQPELAHAVLLHHGLRAGELFFAPASNVRAPNALLSFIANTAVSPECGDWSSPPSGGYANAPHSNFGCATQRNIGEMVADPGDFIQAKPSQGGNASRTDADIFTHQSGTQKPRLLDGGGNIITGQ